MKSSWIYNRVIKNKWTWSSLIGTVVGYLSFLLFSSGSECDCSLTGRIIISIVVAVFFAGVSLSCTEWRSNRNYY